MKSIGAKRAGGWAHWFNGNGPDMECDSITCCHCNRVVFVTVGKPIEAETGWCMRCFKFICKTCEATGVCVPFEERLRQIESRR